jgi:HNH endonuclease
MCGNPRCRNLLGLDLHDIQAVRKDGPNTPENLIPLCLLCHGLHTRGEIDRRAIEQWKLILSLVGEALDRDSMDLLKFLYNHETRTSMPLYVSGDGILRLARLVNTGLVKEGLRSAGGGYWGGGPSTNYHPTLTDIGRLLVQAWLNGNAATVRTLLTGKT